MKWILLVLNLYGCLKWTTGQSFINMGCPKNWQLHNTNCYLFNDTTAMVYEESDAYCGQYGAKLAKVETFTEHKFITDWLRSNFVVINNLWYTSGQWHNGYLRWSDQDLQPSDSTHYWLIAPVYRWSPLSDVTFRIVYAHYELYKTPGNTQPMSTVYGWANVTASTLGYPICEISREDAEDIDILERDFDYGLGTSEPRTIEKGPVIELQPNNTVMIEGAKSVEFYCSASGNPQPEYTWHYGDNFTRSAELQSSTRRTLSGNALMISEPIERDVGAYHCRAKNDVGVVLSNQANMIMGMLGHFSNIDPQAVRASAFKGTKIDCDTPANNPGVAFSWFKNFASNIFIWPDNPNIFVSDSGSLYFSEVQPTDAGKRYFCVVSLIATEGYQLAKANTESRTNRGFLMELSSDSTSDNDYGPILNIHAFPTPALKGRTVRLECVAYGTHPLTYSWRRQDGKNFVEGTTISALGRVLTIRNTPISAEGNYICECVRGSGARAEQIISVTIETIPYFPYPIKHMLVDPDMNIKWYCKAVSRPAAVYTWYKNGKLLFNSPGKIRIVRNVLHITKVNKDDDEGMYQCAATNAHGTTFSTGQLKVLSFTPNFKRFPLPEVTLAAQGSNLTIPCDVEAAPRPEVSWLKNGGNMGLFPGDFGGRVSMDSKYSLVFMPVEYSDVATYTCSSNNALGEAQDSTRLVVTEGARLITRPTNQDVQVNRTAFFYCQASYNHAYDLTYVWKFNGRIVDNKLNPEFVSGRRQNIEGLYITNTQYKHEGLYECEAMSTMGSDSAAARLRVLGPPGPPAGLYADDDTVTARSVRLVWTVSAYIHHGGPITGYDFEAETNYKPGEWRTVASDVPEYFANSEATNNGFRQDQRSYVVDNLIPNTLYRFRVRAVNLYGRGQEASVPTRSVKITATDPVLALTGVTGGGDRVGTITMKWQSSVKITATAPVLAPTGVTGGGGRVGTVTMKWQILDIAEHCGPGLKYWVYWKKMGDERDWKKSNGNDTKALTRGLYVGVVGEDNYYLQYQFKVGAYNDIGHGPNSTVTVIFSSMGMPAATPITYETISINATAVEVWWEPIDDDREHMKGRVAGYRIHYYENLPPWDYNAIEMSREPDPNIVGMKTRNVYGQQDHALIIGLTPNTEQFVRVQVFNTAGYGPKGEWRRAETFNNPVSAYPTHIEVHPHGLHSVSVKWRGVSIKPMEESLMGYIIRVWKIQEDVRSATDTMTEKDTEAVVSGLQRHTVYVLRVLGYSRAGDGAISEAVYFSVLGGRIPFDPTTSEICFAFDERRDCSGGEHVYSSGIVLFVGVLLYLWC